MEMQTQWQADSCSGALEVTAVVASTKPHKQVNYIQFNYVAAVANASISNGAEHMKNILKQNDASRRGDGGYSIRCVHIKRMLRR